MVYDDEIYWSSILAALISTVDESELDIVNLSILLVLS
jgi:hypothetical protein